MNKIITTVFVGFFCMAVGLTSGCSTVQGLGKDISKGGRDIQRAAS